MPDAAPIAVVMPVYNGAAYLEEAMRGILAQTFTDFTCIVVDDGSTDDTPLLLERFTAQDSRVRVVRNTTNMGIAHALNRGIAEADCELIARADADDVLHPDRLRRQYAFMCQHPEVVACGANLCEYDSGRVWEMPSSDAQIRVQMLFSSPILHPISMFRKRAFQAVGGYVSAMVPAEDYDLWERLSHLEEARFASLPDVLLRYRLPDATKTVYLERRARQADAVRLRALQLLGLEPDARQWHAHSLLCGTVESATMRDWFAVLAWAVRLLSANARRGALDQYCLFLELRALGRRRAIGRRLLREVWHRHVPFRLRHALQRVRAEVGNTRKSS